MLYQIQWEIMASNAYRNLRCFAKWKKNVTFHHTPNHLQEIPPIKGFPKKSGTSPNFPNFFSFDFIEFSMTYYLIFNNTHSICLSLMKWPLCTLIHWGSSNRTKTMMGPSWSGRFQPMLGRFKSLVLVSENLIGTTSNFQNQDFILFLKEPKLEPKPK